MLERVTLEFLVVVVLVFATKWSTSSPFSSQPVSHVKSTAYPFFLKTQTLSELFDECCCGCCT